MTNPIRNLIFICFAALWSGVCFGTALSDLADSLSPGEFQELNTNGFGDGQFLRQGTNTAIDFADSAAWDPNTRKFLFIGAAHGEPTKFIIYDEASNSWSEGPHPCGGCGSHAYDHNTIDPASGVFYWRHPSALDQSIVYRYDVSGGTWLTPLPNDDWVMANSTRKRGHRFAGMAYFPDRNELITIGSRSVRNISITGSNNNLGSDHDSPNDWGSLGSYNYGSNYAFVEYNPVHNLILFGGGKSGDDVSRSIYTLGPNGSVQQKNDSPVTLMMSNSGSVTKDRSLMTVDPASGDYLVLSDVGKLHVYNPVSDTWNTNTRTLPWGSYSVATPVSTHGVIMFVAEKKVWVYKHGDCDDCSPPDPDTVAPAVPTALEVQ